MIALLGPPEWEHYCSQAQKGRLNADFFFLLFLVSVLLWGWRELGSLKETIKGMKSMCYFWGKQFRYGPTRVFL